MTVVYFIRHGQASFGSDDYDRLSETGIRQAAIIGEHLAGGLSAAVSGCLRRQRDTAHHALAAAGGAVDATASAAFDEYRPAELLKAYLPAIQAKDDRIAAAGTALTENPRLYVEALRQATRLWVDGVSGPAGETWPDFRRRVGEGLEATVAGRAKDDRVAVFTSGGVIAVILGQILGLSSERIFDLNWRVYNASISEIHFGRSGFAMVGFNAIGHLPREMVTLW